MPNQARWLVGGGGVALVRVDSSRFVTPSGVAPCVRSLLSAGHQVVTGCDPAGVDVAVRDAAPGDVVVHAAGWQPWQLAARTCALVAQVRRGSWDSARGVTVWSVSGDVHAWVFVRRWRGQLACRRPGGVRRRLRPLHVAG
ncbi:MAG: hypothetical protein U0075_12350 [Thermomicrobiales bacterium]